VAALCVGALFPVIDLGRPDRFHFVFVHGRWQSPIVWDVIAISTYLVATFLYLFLLMIPDMALLRDRPGQAMSRWRRILYRQLSFGWVGGERQRRTLSQAGTMMAIAIIPIAVTVHTVLAWLFSMNLRENWNSTIFGPFFVAGAVFSGIATIIVIMAVVRKIYHLEEYITEKHFVYLGYLLAAFTLIMIYGNLSEYVTSGYKLEQGEEFHFRQLFLEQFAGFYWYYFVGGLVIPGLLILLPWTRNIWGVVVAALLADAAMWVERYFIVVAGLRVPLMPYEPSNYAPSWIELSIVAAGFALFALLVTLFIKVFPIIAVWEVAEEHESAEISPAPGRLVPRAARELAGGGSQ
jgi:molybdopterin-containing oxidoreductase family membrane subunit